MLTKPGRMTVVVLTLCLLATPTTLYAQTAPNSPSESKPSAPTLTPDNAGMSVEVSWASHVPSGREVKWEVLAWWYGLDSWTRLDGRCLSTDYCLRSRLD